MKKRTRSRFAASVLAAGALTLGAVQPSEAANDILNPSQKLYVNWSSGAVASARTLTGQDRTNALMIAGQPTATWLTSGTPEEDEARARDLVLDAAAEKSIPVIVAYYLPFRDCQQYSAGGAADTAEYQAWIDGLAAGIGNAKAVVLVEPDGLGIIPHYTSITGATEWCQPAELDPATAASDRFVQLNYAVDVLTALPNTAVYLDGTHSAWLGSGESPPGRDLDGDVKLAGDDRENVLTGHPRTDQRADSHAQRLFRGQGHGGAFLAVLRAVLGVVGPLPALLLGGVRLGALAGLTETVVQTVADAGAERLALLLRVVVGSLLIELGECESGECLNVVCHVVERDPVVGDVVRVDDLGTVALELDEGLSGLFVSDDVGHGGSFLRLTCR